MNLSLWHLWQWQLKQISQPLIVISFNLFAMICTIIAIEIDFHPSAADDFMAVQFLM